MICNFLNPVQKYYKNCIYASFYMFLFACFKKKLYLCGRKGLFVLYIYEKITYPCQLFVVNYHHERTVL